MALTVEFLTSVRGFLKTRDGEKLRQWLVVEPPVPQQYHKLSQELKQSYQDSAAVGKLIERCLPEEDDLPDDQGTAWPGFVAFMKDFFEYWRDVDFEDLLGAHQMLTGLTKYVI
jgi:nuclear mRNA export protein PCID2/THP1